MNKRRQNLLLFLQLSDMKILALTPIEIVAWLFAVKHLIEFERERKVLESLWESLGESGWESGCTVAKPPIIPLWPTFDNNQSVGLVLSS